MRVILGVLGVFEGYFGGFGGFFGGCFLAFLFLRIVFSKFSTVFTSGFFLDFLWVGWEGGRKVSVEIILI